MTSFRERKKKRLDKKKETGKEPIYSWLEFLADLLIFGGEIIVRGIFGVIKWILELAHHT